MSNHTTTSGFPEHPWLKVGVQVCCWISKRTKNGFTTSFEDGEIRELRKCKFQEEYKGPYDDQEQVNAYLATMPGKRFQMAEVVKPIAEAKILLDGKVQKRWYSISLPNCEQKPGQGTRDDRISIQVDTPKLFYIIDENTRVK